jgi:hypothetical protein
VRALPLPVALGAAIEDVPGLELAWLSGNDSSPTESVYLLLVGEMSVEAIDGVFARSRVALDPVAGSQSVELAYFRPRDWQSRVEKKDHFAAALREHRRLELLPPAVVDEETTVAILQLETESAKGVDFSAD